MSFQAVWDAHVAKKAVRWKLYALGKGLASAHQKFLDKCGHMVRKRRMVSTNKKDSENIKRETK